MSGPNPHSHRQRPRDSQPDFPPLPSLPSLPSLRTLSAARDRDRDRDRDRERDRDSASSVSSLPADRPQTRYWSATAARRAERIHNFTLSRTMDHQPWHSSSSSSSSARRTGRMRNAPEPRAVSSFDDLDRSLDEANSHLIALLDLTTHAHLATPLVPPSFSPPPPPRAHDFSDDNRRSKRRKLDSERLASDFRAFRYGRYGQVEPGQLRMEIVSCDGGMFSNESSYAAENILKNDNSVYCTKGNRCNIVLRHQGATVFTLQELVIKAPGSMNYSHPVREGMVFVAMNQDDMLSRTAQYQIQYASKERPWHAEGDNRLVLEREPRHIISIRHHDDGTTSTRTRRSFAYRPDDDDDRVPQMPDEFATNLPDFRVTIECSDDEEDDGLDRRRFRRAPNRIGSLPFESRDSDSEDLSNPFGSEDPADDLLLHHSRRHNILRDRDRDPDRLPSIALAEAVDAHTNATQEAVRAVGGGELLTPHARFFIEKKKSKCTIKFDPPVSGRFILLKMWGSQHDPGSNIDIQSVIARGFAGPRYFPSVELR